MTILLEDSLEFAKEHISKYYDSDFFPKAMEFEAIWHNWDEVKSELTAKNIQKLQVYPPRSLPAKKPEIGFRIVHQLDPLNSIVYTALAHQVAPAVEAARIPENHNVACSYRIKLSNDSFFGSGNGYDNFLINTEKLAGDYSFVLTTDISDFYNQIYLHRLNNAIEFSNDELKAVGDDIENFLTKLNSKTSQGIPVGPAASVIMAEAILIDVDSFIQERDFHHTRYVDDFRIFSNSKRQLTKILQDLTYYLYENHRLSLSPRKTEIMGSREFLDSRVHNDFQLEKIKIFKDLKRLNPYTGEVETYEIEVEDKEELLKERLLEISKRLLEFKYIDLGISRNVIRKARYNKITEISNILLENISFFAPVINDLMLYIFEITNDEFIAKNCEVFENIINSEFMDNALCKIWLEWYLSQFKDYQANATIKAFLYNSKNTYCQAQTAVQGKNLNWIRERKTSLYNYGDWGRRAVIFGASILPGDERRNWLKLLINTSPIIMDRWIAKWILDTQ
jgi:hypothetical protein